MLAVSGALQLRNIMRVFPRSTFSLEESYSLHFSRNIPFDLGRNTHYSPTLHPLWSTWGWECTITIKYSFWRCSHESCRVAEGYQVWATSPELVWIGHSWIIYWKQWIQQGTLPSWHTPFFPKALAISHSRENIYHTASWGNLPLAL